MPDDFKWFQLVIQGGSFGLLAALFFFAARWLPKRLKETDALREVERKDNRAERRELQEAFRAEQKAEREQCSHQFAVLAEGIHKQNGALAHVVAASDKQTEMAVQSLALLREHHSQAMSAMKDIGDLKSRKQNG